MKHFCIFGTHPRLSLAELRAITSDIPAPILCGRSALIEDQVWNGNVLMNQLGGTVKLGDIIAELDGNDFTTESVFKCVFSRIHESSINFGWNIFGGTRNIRSKLAKLAIPFKKTLKAHHIASRWVTGEHDSTLSPAAVAKLKLPSKGLDICLFVHGTTISIGLTSNVQDADAWSKRDYGRPIRDSANGMLPPKLARIMVNLASVPKNGTILDPFCGSGTILMEAALATHAKKIIGSDNKNTQVTAAKQNTEWLINQHIIHLEDEGQFQFITSDVQKLSTHLYPSSIDCVITEGTLGPLLKGHERQAELEKTSKKLSLLWEETLNTIRPILNDNGTLVCIWPAFKTQNGSARVDLNLQLTSLGYDLIDPLGGWESSKGPLIYQRPNQHISRRIVILKKSA